MNHGKSSSRLYWRARLTYLDNADELARDDREQRDDNTARSMELRRHTLDFKTAGDRARGQVDVAA